MEAVYKDRFDGYIGRFYCIRQSGLYGVKRALKRRLNRPDGYADNRAFITLYRCMKKSAKIERGYIWGYVWGYTIKTKCAEWGYIWGYKICQKKTL